MRLFLWVNAAFIYDLLIIMALSIALSALFTSVVGVGFNTLEGWRFIFQLLWGAMIASYYLYSWRKTGQTIGMRAWRLRVVREDGMALDGKDALFRLGTALLNLLLLNLGWLGYLSRSNMSLTDYLSKTRIGRIKEE